MVQALLDAAAVADYPVDVVALVSDQPDAGALGRAEAMGIATAVVQPGAHPDRTAWDEALRATIASFAPDWVVSAGFMRLLGPSVLDAFPGRIVNTHPALLPSFPGVRASLMRWTTVSESPAARCIWWIPEWTPAPSWRSRR